MSLWKQNHQSKLRPKLPMGKQVVNPPLLKHLMILLSEDWEKSVWGISDAFVGCDDRSEKNILMTHIHLFFPLLSLYVAPSW